MVLGRVGLSRRCRVVEIGLTRPAQRFVQVARLLRLCRASSHQTVEYEKKMANFFGTSIFHSIHSPSAPTTRLTSSETGDETIQKKSRSDKKCSTTTAAISHQRGGLFQYICLYHPTASPHRGKPFYFEHVWAGREGGGKSNS